MICWKVLTRQSINITFNIFLEIILTQYYSKTEIAYLIILLTDIVPSLLICYSFTFFDLMVTTRSLKSPPSSYLLVHYCFHFPSTWVFMGHDVKVSFAYSLNSCTSLFSLYASGKAVNSKEPAIHFFCPVRKWLRSARMKPTLGQMGTPLNVLSAASNRAVKFPQQIYYVPYRAWQPILYNIYFKHSLLFSNHQLLWITPHP